MFSKDCSSPRVKFVDVSLTVNVKVLIPVLILDRLTEELCDYARFSHSINSASALNESEFSRMGALLSSRRLGYTLDNADKRLTMSNLLSNKRKLDSYTLERGVKRQKLSETLFVSKKVSKS